MAVVCNPRRMGRWSELMVVCVCHSDEMMREADANDTSTLHTLNNTVAKGFNQMAPPARTITVGLDMIKAFETLIRKLLQTNIPVTIIRLIANYIKGTRSLHNI